MRAAVTEGVEPPALGLVALRKEPTNVTDEGKAQALTAAAGIAANPSPRGRPYSVDGLNGLLLRALDDRAWMSAVTRA